MNCLLSLLLLFLPLTILAGCSLPQSMPLLNKEPPQTVLKIGIAPDAPPFIYRKDGRMTGLEHQFAADLARFTGSSPAFIELPRQGLAEALLDGTVDIIMSGITAEEARTGGVVATAPYLISGQVVLVRLNDFKRLGQGPRHLGDQDVRIGAVTGTDGERFIRGLNTKGRQSLYTTAMEGVQALLSHAIDVFIHDLPANFYYASIFIDKGLTPGTAPMTREELVWAVHPDNTNLLQAANDFLQTMQQSAELGRLLERSIPFYQHASYSPKQ
jgi:polar amino acid transport system substrate-binding protein